MKIIYVSAAYCYKCDKYFKIPLVSRGSWKKKIGKCSKCGGSLVRKSVVKGSEQDPRARTEYVNICEKETERYSASLGVSDEGLADARKLHPQAEWKKFGNSWRPKIRNRSEKLKLMKQAGYSEYPSNMFNQIHGDRK